MRLSEIIRSLRHRLMRSVDVVHQTTGYNIVINGVFFYRWERHWKTANKITLQLQRKGIRAEMRRVVARNLEEITA